MRTHLVLAAILSLATVACSDDPVSPPHEAQVRFVNAAPGSDDVDLRAATTTVATDIDFGSATPDYAIIAPGAVALDARIDATSLATLQGAFTSGGAYTVVLTKRAAGAALVSFTDDRTATSGKAKLRVIHAAPSTGAVDVYVTAADADLATATPVATAIAVEKATNYLTLDPATRRVRVTLAGTKTVVLDVAGVTLEAGKNRTILVLDAAAGGTPLRSIALTDRN